MKALARRECAATALPWIWMILCAWERALHPLTVVSSTHGVIALGRPTLLEGLPR